MFRCLKLICLHDLSTLFVSTHCLFNLFSHFLPKRFIFTPHFYTLTIITSSPHFVHALYPHAAPLVSVPCPTLLLGLYSSTIDVEQLKRSKYTERMSSHIVKDWRPFHYLPAVFDFSVLSSNPGPGVIGLAAWITWLKPHELQLLSGRKLQKKGPLTKSSCSKCNWDPLQDVSLCLLLRHIWYVMLKNGEPWKTMINQASPQSKLELWGYRQCIFTLHVVIMPDVQQPRDPLESWVHRSAAKAAAWALTALLPGSGDHAPAHSEKSVCSEAHGAALGALVES